MHKRRRHTIFTSLTVVVLAPLFVSAPASAAEEELAERLSFALDSVPAEHLVDFANVESLAAEMAAGEPLEVLTPAGEATGVSITEVAVDGPGAIVSLSAGRKAVTRSSGSYTTAQQKSDGSVQIITMIESAASPTEYSFDLTLPQGAYLELTQDGSVIAYGAGGEFVAGVHKPWAVDANNEPVPTHFTITGNRLTQVVSHDQDDAFPVVADPWLGADLYGRVNATSVSEGYVLTTTPTAWGAGFSGPTQVSMWWAHADEVKNKVPRGYGWSLSLQEQLYCHIAGWPVSANPSYDLESWKPHVRWDLQIPSKCLGGYSPGS